MRLLVLAQPGRPESVAHWHGHTLPCLVGQNGPVEAMAKREGDGCTPLGTWRPLYGMYRADRGEKPEGPLPWRALTPEDGWCDAATDPLYNSFCPKGYAASHEALWRDDAAYDYIGVLSHNTAPVVPGAGSAVFVHVWKDGATHTAGCVALRKEALLVVLPTLTEVEIRLV